MTQPARNGDTVKVHYTGSLEDGTVFDSSREREPMEFTLGEGQLIPGFEQATLGLQPGERTSVQIPAVEAYGEHRDEMVGVFGREQFPQEMNVEVGMQLQMQQPDGQPIIVTVTNVSAENVTLDANHPLAGKDLSFDIELVEIV